MSHDKTWYLARARFRRIEPAAQSDSIDGLEFDVLARHVDETSYCTVYETV
jgi:hypothetical protein